MPPFPARRPALRQRVPAGLVGMALGEAPDGGGCRGRRRSRGAEQMMQREPVSAASLGRQPARRCGQLLVGRPLALRAVHADRHGVTARQLQRHDGARVAHHGVAHQRAQALGIGGLARLAGGHVGSAKFLQRLEDARLEQREHVVELGEIVLHRRRRQQQQEALVERVHQFVALAGAVAQMMGLVDDDEIEAAADQARGMLAPTRQRERSDQAASGSRTGPGRCAAARRGWSRRECRTWSRAPPATARRATPGRARARSRPCRAAGTP